MSLTPQIPAYNYKMSDSWSAWALDRTQSNQDPNSWHVYRARRSEGEWNYETRREPKQSLE
jgi:hypothetical protein